MLYGQDASVSQIDLYSFRGLFCVFVDLAPRHVSSESYHFGTLERYS